MNTSIVFILKNEKDFWKTMFIFATKTSEGKENSFVWKFVFMSVLSFSEYVHNKVVMVRIVVMVQF